MNGTNILIYKKVGSSFVAIAASRTTKVQSSCDLIECSDPSTGDWRAYVPGRKEWSVNLGWLVVDEDDVQQLLDVGERYQLKFSHVDAAANEAVAGYAYLKTCEITANRGGVVQGTFQFVGDGELQVE